MRLKKLLSLKTQLQFASYFLATTITLFVVLTGIIKVYEFISYQESYFNIAMIETVQAEVKKEIVMREVKSETIREVSAYNAGDVNQTDSSPCISANGENICNALKAGYKRCAANFVPLGTDLLIEHYGECKVTDRMNSRYTNRVDIAMTLEEKERAIKFGLQLLNVRILDSL